jgi:hypothetical protein
MKTDKFFKWTMRGVVSGHSLKHLAAGLGVISYIAYVIDLGQH